MGDPNVVEENFAPVHLPHSPRHPQRSHRGHCIFWMRLHRMGLQCMKKHDTSPVTAFRSQMHSTLHDSTTRTSRPRRFIAVTSAGSDNKSNIGK